MVPTISPGLVALLARGLILVVAPLVTACVSGGVGSGGGRQEMEKYIGGCAVAVRCSVTREADGSFRYSVSEVLKSPGDSVRLPDVGETMIALSPEAVPPILVTENGTIPSPTPDFAIVCVENPSWHWLPGRTGKLGRVTIYHGVKSVSHSMRFTYEFP